MPPRPRSGSAPMSGTSSEALLESLERVTSDDAVLVLDDVHHVKDPITATSLALFVQHLPSWLHIVMAGRTDPPIPLDRLRVRGQIAEMRFAELRFTPAEAGEVLARLAPELPEADVDGWVEYTDGWAAGSAVGGAVGPLGPGAAAADVGADERQVADRGLRLARGPRDGRTRRRRPPHAGVRRRPRQRGAGDGDHRARRRARAAPARRGAGAVRVPPRDRGLVPDPSAGTRAAVRAAGSVRVPSRAPRASRELAGGRRRDGQRARPVAARRAPA